MQNATVTFEQAMFVVNALMGQAELATHMVEAVRKDDIADGVYDAEDTNIRLDDAADCAENAAKILRAMYSTSDDGVKVAVVQEALWSYDTEWRETVLENIEDEAKTKGFTEVLDLCNEYLDWKNAQYA